MGWPGAGETGRPGLPGMTDHPATACHGQASGRGPLADAVRYLLSLPDRRGWWEGEVVRNTMLLSQYVLTCRMVGRWPLPPRDRGPILGQYQVPRRGDGVDDCGSFPRVARSAGRRRRVCLPGRAHAT